MYWLCMLLCCRLPHAPSKLPCSCLQRRPRLFVHPTGHHTVVSCLVGFRV